MACVICEHCNTPVTQHQELAVLNGYSFHERCHKCFYCSETNLKDAEVFKGAIFCSSCSQRIFQGCATARRRVKESSKTTKGKSHRRRSYRTKERTEHRPHNILEMAGLTACNDSSKSCSDYKEDSKATLIKLIAKSTEKATLKAENPNFNENSKSITRSAVETGMITDMTQQLLKQMILPAANNQKNFTKILKTSPKPRKKSPCSDLRMAEFGTSREIANMALRHKSELPVIIKSETLTKPLTSQNGSLLNRESVESGDQNEKWIESNYSTLKGSTMISRLMDRRFQSVVKIPFKSFKRNILNRSSLVSELVSSEDKATLVKRIKVLFRQEITEHQKRGLRRLYSAVNRQKIPNRLGWLNLVANAHGDDKGPRLSHGSCRKRCKHFQTSHSYRCMRAQVMNLAGPTKSQLAMYRTKVKTLLAPGFLRNIDHGRVAIMITQACGSSKPASLKQ